MIEIIVVLGILVLLTIGNVFGLSMSKPTIRPPRDNQDDS